LEYIEQNILKLLIYFLYSNKELEFSKIDFKESLLLIEYAILNGFVDSFYFKINKTEMDKYHEPFENGETKHEENTIGRLFQVVERDRANDKEISFYDLKDSYKDLVVEFFHVYIFYKMFINPNGKSKLQRHLNDYINYFRNDNLTSTQRNYYPFSKCLYKSIKIFDSFYNKLGKRFGFSGLKDLDSIEVEIENELRIYEILLYFLKKEYIKIDNYSFIPLDERYENSISLTFNKSPNDIYNIENSKIIREKKKIIESKLKFDDEKSIISYEGKICEIPKYTNQYIVCKTIFNHEIGHIISENDIYHKLSIMETEEKKRTIYDAVRAINKKAEEKLYIEHLLIWEKSTVKINDSIDK
jgi:hypothetical protein